MLITTLSKILSTTNPYNEPFNIDGVLQNVYEPEPGASIRNM
jgi:hypothetical protein